MYSVYLRMEVGVVRRRWVSVGGVLVIALVLSCVAASAATSLFGTRFRAGETIQFQVEDSSSWVWGCCGCCSCETTTILGWRIMDMAGQAIYSVVHDAPVSASVWLGTWEQTKIDGMAAASGQYILYVDTSVGTLSRCFSIYDPCDCCRTCYSCVCDHVSSITECGCKASLVFVDSCTTGCFFPFFGLFGGCWTASCSGGCP